MQICLVLKLNKICKSWTWKIPVVFVKFFARLLLFNKGENVNPSSIKNLDINELRFKKKFHV